MRVSKNTENSATRIKKKKKIDSEQYRETGNECVDIKV